MNSALRVLVVTETFPPEVNGVARTVAGYCDGLRARGNEVHVLRPRQSCDPQTIDDPQLHLCQGVRIPRYKSLQFGLPRPGAVLDLVDELRPDVLYVATEGPLGHAALRSARQIGIGVVTGFHTNFHEYSRHYGLGVVAELAFAWLRRFHNRAAATLVGTDALRDQLTGAGFRHVRYSPRGVDTELFAPWRRDRALRGSWGAGGDAPVVMSVGRIAAEKNLRMVTDAFAVFRSAQPYARLVIVGDGPLRAQLARSQPEAIFTGVQTGLSLAAHYASADILLFPSLTETFGNITLEAMASGLALVAYDYAAARQHVRHRQSGLLAKFDDAESYLDCIRQLALQSNLIESLRRNARLDAEQLGLTRVHAALEQVLREHAGQARRRRAA